jgi:hypothetical protein
VFNDAMSSGLRWHGVDCFCFLPATVLRVLGSYGAVSTCRITVR